MFFSCSSAAALRSACSPGRCRRRSTASWASERFRGEPGRGRADRRGWAATAGWSAVAGQVGMLGPRSQHQLGPRSRIVLLPGVIGEPEQVVLVPVGEHDDIELAVGVLGDQLRDVAHPSLGAVLARGRWWSRSRRAGAARRDRRTAARRTPGTQEAVAEARPGTSGSGPARTVAHHASPESSSVLCSSANACPRPAPSEKPSRLLRSLRPARWRYSTRRSDAASRRGPCGCAA